MKRKGIASLCALLIYLCVTLMSPISANAATFTNPLGDGADPWVVYNNGFYYMPIIANNKIYLNKSQRLQDIGNPAKKLWIKIGDMPTDLSDTWAPEVHYINGKWYFYFCAHTGDFNRMKMRVFESASSDIESMYTYKGALDTGDYYSIDGTILQADSKLYMIWSSCKNSGISNPTQLYIAEMSSPTAMKTAGARTMISEPTNSWEGNVNEGPTILTKNGTYHIIYSANDFTKGDYCLAQLTCTNTSNFTSASSWTKTGPVFSRTTDVWGPGHASFLLSPNQTEVWMIYHAKKYKDTYTWDRQLYIQKFTWSGNNPNFGSPVSPGVALDEPAGTPNSSLISIGKTATSSSQHSSGSFPASKVTDKVIDASGWASYGSNSDWVTVDLGSAHTIKKIEIYSRRDVDQAERRRNYVVWASNNSDMSGYVQLGTIDSNGFPYQGKWTQNVTNTTKYRYISVRKTQSGEPSYIEELAIYGAP